MFVELRLQAPTTRQFSFIGSSDFFFTGVTSSNSDCSESWFLCSSHARPCIIQFCCAFSIVLEDIVSVISHHKRNLNLVMIDFSTFFLEYSNPLPPLGSKTQSFFGIYIVQNSYIHTTSMYFHVNSIMSFSHLQQKHPPFFSDPWATVSPHGLGGFDMEKSRTSPFLFAPLSSKGFGYDVIRVFWRYILKL